MVVVAVVIVAVVVMVHVFVCVCVCVCDCVSCSFHPHCADPQRCFSEEDTPSACFSPRVCLLVPVSS